MTQSQGMPPTGGASGDESGPVFADPSGQRRRLLRLLGAGSSVLLVGALILAGIGLFGGPDTPFSVFSAPHASDHDHAGAAGRQGREGHSAPGQHAPGPAPGSATSPGRSPSPSRSAAPSSPAPRPSTSPAPTNSAGKTPPGLSRTKKPHPSPSPHAT